MMSFAALVLGSSLMAMTGGADIPAEDQDADETPAEPQPSRREVRRAKQIRSAVNGFFGITLELGSALFHYENAAVFIGTDLKLASAGCDAPDKPCSGSPIVLAIPPGATTMGWIGAAFLAEAREANLRDSSVYWVGTGVEVAAYLVFIGGGEKKARSARLAWDTTFVSMAALGTILQVVGAFTGPTRAEVEAVASHSSHVVPGCAPISGGLVCGIAMAGF
jgi:hypothetical protein